MLRSSKKKHNLIIENEKDWAKHSVFSFVVLLEAENEKNFFYYAEKNERIAKNSIKKEKKLQI